MPVIGRSGSVRASIRVKLFGGFAIVVALLVASIVVGVSMTSSLNSSARKSFAEDAIPLKSATQDLTTQMVNQETGVRGFLVTGDRAALAPYYAGLKGVKADLAAAQPHLAAHPIMAGLIKRATTQINALQDYFASQVRLAGSGPQGLATARTRVFDGKAKFDAYRATAARIDADGKKFVGDTVASQQAHADSARRTLLILGVVATLIAMGIAFYVSTGIRRSVADVLDRVTSLRDRCVASLRSAISAMAAGDLTQPVEVTTEKIDRISGDELGDVATAINTIIDATRETGDAYEATRESLAGIIGEVDRTTTMLSTSSQQMASTSDETGRAVTEIAQAVGEVAAGSERQVRSVEGAKANVERLSASARESAQTAETARNEATETERVAQEGASSVARATEMMDDVTAASQRASEAIRELGSKSEQIGGIVDTITTIAEQTNLLALNAAIEAARAGDQGRGFAVVADEVRKLAEESQQAAASIAALIGDIQEDTRNAVSVVESGAERTAEGARTVDEARASFERIAERVGTMTSAIEEIVHAATRIAEESTTIDGEITEVASIAEESSASSEQVSASTQQTSASAQEIAASAQELAGTATELEKLVSRFTLTR